MTPPFDFDIAIIGAGPVALALAGWLAHRGATRTLSIALIDAHAPGDLKNDPRALTLSYGSRTLLEPLNWPTAVTPIKYIHISQRGTFGRMRIDHREHNLPALGYVVRYGALISALAEVVHASPIHWLMHTTAGTPSQQIDGNGVTVPIKSASQARQLRTQILINAQGGSYNTQRWRPIRRDYQQTALVGRVSVDAPQPNVAWERFTNEGPLALLPLGGAGNADYAVVWCASADNAQRRLQLHGSAFLAELHAIFGTWMGRFVAVTDRTLFPLGLNALKTVVDHRIVAIGNAAQTLHPVAGQGLNLGLRDAYTLIDVILQAGITPAALADFEKRRHADRRTTRHLTDKLARAFTATASGCEPFAPFRGLMLTALECLSPIKSALTQQMIFGGRG